MNLEELPFCEQGLNCEPCWTCEDRHWCAHYDVQIWHGQQCDDCKKRPDCEHVGKE